MKPVLEAEVIYSTDPGLLAKGGQKRRGWPAGIRERAGHRHDRPRPTAPSLTGLTVHSLVVGSRPCFRYASMSVRSIALVLSRLHVPA